MHKKSAMYDRVQKAKKVGPFEVLVGILAFLVLPAAVTLMAPVSTVKLDYREGNVSARVTTNIFVVVPCWTRTLDSVTEATTHFISGTVEPVRSGSETPVRSEDESAVVLKGPNGSISVPTSPVNDNERVARVREFLKNPNEAGLWFYSVANWKFSVIGGGFLSLLSLFFLVVVMQSMGTWLWVRTLGWLRRPR